MRFTVDDDGTIPIHLGEFSARIGIGDGDKLAPGTIIDVPDSDIGKMINNMRETIKLKISMGNKISIDKTSIIPRPQIDFEHAKSIILDHVGNALEEYSKDDLVEMILDCYNIETAEGLLELAGNHFEVDDEIEQNEDYNLRDALKFMKEEVKENG